MADYRELLRKAVEALPENNGAARRQVYEKARTALVSQLRAIQPPLPPREITQHRLQLEDCIRQVEQQATDALLGNFKKIEEEASAHTTPAPASAEEAVVNAVAENQAAEELAEEVVAQRAVAQTEDMETAEEAEPIAEEQEGEAPEELEEEVEPEAAEDIEASESEEAFDPIEQISGAEGEDLSVNAVARDPYIAEAEPADTPSRSDLTELEAALRAEAGDKGLDTPRKSDDDALVGITTPSTSVEQLIAEAGIERPVSENTRPGSIGFLIKQAQNAADKAATPMRWSQDSSKAGAVSSPNATSVVAVAEPEEQPIVAKRPANQSEPLVAMSSVREVDLEEAPVIVPEAPEAEQDEDGDPQGAIDRAIQTLDREARGEKSGDEQPVDDHEHEAVIAGATDAQSDEVEPRGGSALTIFLVLVALLLAGVGGAGYWAWQEGYFDPDAMFGQSEQVAETPASDTGTATQTEGPGNTAATPEAVAPVDQDLSNSEERLSPAEDATVANDDADDPVTVDAQTADNAAAQSAASELDKSEERLPTEGSFDSDQAATATDAETAGTEAPAAVASAGPQSLLLEASEAGTTGAVPYSGTVEWSRGTDELGQPTILASASIPARNLSVDFLIRRNADPALPASHLMEVDFTVNESFIGGAIAGLPGILLKNEELVRGTPLVGASARVVGSSFLFALSASEQDVATNTNLLRTRKWMDLALVYATGSRAIITLEKDAEAEALFEDVMAAWDAEAGAAASTGN